MYLECSSIMYCRTLKYKIHNIYLMFYRSLIIVYTLSTIPSFKDQLSVIHASLFSNLFILMFITNTTYKPITCKLKNPLSCSLDVTLNPF